MFLFFRETVQINAEVISKDQLFSPHKAFAVRDTISLLIKTIMALILMNPFVQINLLAVVPFHPQSYTRNEDPLDVVTLCPSMAEFKAKGKDYWKYYVIGGNNYLTAARAVMAENPSMAEEIPNPICTIYTTNNIGWIRLVCSCCQTRIFVIFFQNKITKIRVSLSLFHWHSLLVFVFASSSTRIFVIFFLKKNHKNPYLVELFVLTYSFTDCLVGFGTQRCGLIARKDDHRRQTSFTSQRAEGNGVEIWRRRSCP
jgi:hypothetical protein